MDIHLFFLFLVCNENEHAVKLPSSYLVRKYHNIIWYCNDLLHCHRIDQSHRSMLVCCVIDHVDDGSSDSNERFKRNTSERTSERTNKRQKTQATNSVEEQKSDLLVNRRACAQAHTYTESRDLTSSQWLRRITTKRKNIWPDTTITVKLIQYWNFSAIKKSFSSFLNWKWMGSNLILFSNSVALDFSVGLAQFESNTLQNENWP